MGGGLAQVVMGTWIFPTLQSYFDNDNDDLAWRVALVIPASIALGVAYYFYYHSVNCPLGNLTQCKMAGLVQERSAVDSFRSGAVHLNAWFLFFQSVMCDNNKNGRLYLLTTKSVQERLASSLGSNHLISSKPTFCLIFFHLRLDKIRRLLGN
jgi:hypothetical protein